MAFFSILFPPLYPVRFPPSPPPTPLMAKRKQKTKRLTVNSVGSRRENEFDVSPVGEPTVAARLVEVGLLELEAVVGDDGAHVELAAEDEIANARYGAARPTVVALDEDVTAQLQAGFQRDADVRG